MGLIALTLARSAALAWGSLGAGRTWVPFPRRARRFPERWERLLGRPLTPEEARCCATGRLVVTVTRAVLKLVKARRLGARTLSPWLDLRGAERLDAARARGRGLILLTAHFGFPLMIRPVLEAADIPFVAIRGAARDPHDLSMAGDLWARTGALHHLRQELAQNHACVILAEGALGVRVTVPLLATALEIGLGPFSLARLADCPILPFFVVAPLGTARFRVEIHPPLPLPAGAGEPHDGIDAFVRLYESYVCRYPCHLGRSG